MVDLPKKKVGIVACSGEELPEGTVTRLAALKVLEQLRPSETVTICLPLFLAGGEGDRAFARFYPTIAVDGCDQRCAARATQMYSGKPAASLVASDLVAENGLESPQGCRRLDGAGLKLVDLTAGRLAEMVDALLQKTWSRRAAQIIAPQEIQESREPVEATCSCGSGIPVQKVFIDGQEVTLTALPLLFEQMRAAGKLPSESVARELLDTVKIYNPVPQGAEGAYAAAILCEYRAYCRKEQRVS
ncbi:MAG: putative zinc-binding protein [Anaerolineales bacterium]|jgi:uncharacterized metal-binding protein